MDDLFARYLVSLSQIEQLPHSKLDLFQRGLIERIVRHARDNTAFYGDRLQPVFNGKDTFDFSRWSEIPILERQHAAKVTTLMRATEVPANCGSVHEITTSGSTGTALRFSTNSLVSTAGNGAVTRLAEWHGVDTSRPLAMIRMFSGEANLPPDGFHTKGWSQASPNADAFGIDMRIPVDFQIDWLERKKAPYLMTSASHAMAIGYAAGHERTQSLGIQAIFLAAETVQPSARDAIQKMFGARIATIYSCQEIGVIAIGCPVSRLYHIVIDNALVEILRPDGTPVEPGETGRIVVTGLHNYATPFIRYAVGDVATAAAGPCGCGRSLPLIAQIEGRTRAEFVFNDGKRMWPRGAHVEEMRRFVSFSEFQLVQLTPNDIEFRFRQEPGKLDIGGLQRYAQEAFHPAVRIHAVAVSDFPRGPGGKHDHFISLVQDAKR
ncbi:MAG: phenylacetate--CoA ligase family protein [Pseudomonadota bacterium]